VYALLPIGDSDSGIVTIISWESSRQHWASGASIVFDNPSPQRRVGAPSFPRRHVERRENFLSWDNARDTQNCDSAYYRWNERNRFPCSQEAGPPGIHFLVVGRDKGRGKKALDEIRAVAGQADFIFP
jgi:hypothetical protein